jgi:hypothetical protein
MAEIESALTPPLAAKLAGQQNVDFSAGDDQIFDTAFDLSFAAERESEAQLWERIKGEYCRGDLAVTGPTEVLKAAAVGRVEKTAVTRDAKIPGTRCRDCENLLAGTPETCTVCGSSDERGSGLRRPDPRALGSRRGGGVAAVLRHGLAGSRPLLCSSEQRREGDSDQGPPG